MSSKCPKCGAKIKPTYLKQSCPSCGVNMLYYKLDEQLEADAEKAQREVDAVNKLVGILKASTIKSPWHIIRLVVFFTPLASMCLPMFWAGHKNVSLITFIMSIINHGFDLGAMASDKSYLFAVLAIICVIVFSLIEIICSLFTETEKGFSRNVSAYFINLGVLAVLSELVFCFDGRAKSGLLVTFGIYVVKIILHAVVSKKLSAKSLVAGAVVVTLIIPCHALITNQFSKGESTICPAISECDASVVSFNVASAFGTSLEDTDSMERCGRFAEYINAYSPDFVGTQEMNSYWLTELDKSLEGYTSYGVKRGGDSEEKNSEMNAIFFKDSYEVLETNTIWLSETPEKESKYHYIDAEGKEAEAGCNRVCTYAVLTDNESIYFFLNTHLDNASEEARVFGASVILNKISALEEQYGDNARVVLTGDFNETSNEEAYKVLTARLNDTTDSSKEKATYQEWGYRQTGDKPIDFIFTTGGAKNYQVLDRLNDGYVSDHYGIYSEINF